ncbi:MAG: hypothetical protein D8B52_04630 [Prevotella sp.]|uniref:Uncharacterized protein n=1 Tax=Hoylesella saccharolytica F0055 TaxID=1127699 RepID=L1NJL6_9BACT|nr:hypothetical protein HMPREF9151_00346 [Hoylesella saccharolytica F0055]RKW60260.1 MAG: hypothetical protein D8B52_04630 [Prevotella sp.]
MFVCRTEIHVSCKYFYKDMNYILICVAIVAGIVIIKKITGCLLRAVISAVLLLVLGYLYYASCR